MRKECCILVTSVPHSLDTVRARGDEAERTSGWNTEVVHRLGDEVLADARAEDGAPISPAREGSAAAAFELQLPPFAILTGHLA